MWRSAMVSLPFLLCALFFRRFGAAQKDFFSEDAATLLKKASENIKIRHYTSAMEELNAALVSDPTLLEAYMHRAFAYRQLCRYEESERDYHKYLTEKSGSATVEKELSQLVQTKNAFDKAWSLFEAGDFSKSLEYLDKVVLVFSHECSTAKLLKVRLLIALKDYSSAIAETGYILKTDENNLEALLLRGQAYYYLADHDVALRHYQKGLRLDPEHNELKKAYFHLKNLLKKTKSAEDNVEKGKFRVAVEEFKAALALDSDHAAHNVHLQLGLCKVLVKLGRGKDAIASCNAALEIDEELIEALVQVLDASCLKSCWCKTLHMGQSICM